MSNLDQITVCLRQAYPCVQAIYLFGSWGTPHQQLSSDLDMALLLPHDQLIDNDDWLNVSLNVASIAAVDTVDLINLRAVDTVFQFQVVTTAKRVLVQDERAADEFELFVFRQYEDLRIQRAAIVQAGIESGRFYGE